MNVDDIAMNAMIADFLNKVGEPQCSGFLVNGNMTACRVTGSSVCIVGYNCTSLWYYYNIQSQ